jgi:hypothetical protein
MSLNHSNALRASQKLIRGQHVYFRLHLFLNLSCAVVMLRFLTVLSLCAIFSSSSVYAASTLVAQLKAAYLIHVSEFTTWPSDTATSFVVCISSKSELREPLEEIQKHTVKGKPIKIQLDVNSNNLNTCHILYTEGNQLPAFQKGLLTFSSEEGFLKNGGIIQFFPQDDRIKMRINLNNLEKSGLIITKVIRSMETE